ncbi:hypothetical protein BJ138DRAFT_868139 [Hygrophoropsis aurantiaca]|uniref:Uncharacterized protein n=1 Tax=Hygrophoropsis aurantiaca TaxID=72124 RepID=A0ACB7ZWM7_9AGAM|nr:hypothetical protein BJ138DRAFT_868139 [Hygrophoropsis aurantiaca]
MFHRRCHRTSEYRSEKNVTDQRTKLTHVQGFEKLKSQDGIEHTVIILGLVTGMPWSWFGPISDNVASDFDISLDQVNWLGNIISCLYLPVSLSVPLFCSRYGIRRC